MASIERTVVPELEELKSVVKAIKVLYRTAFYSCIRFLQVVLKTTSCIPP